VFIKKKKISGHEYFYLCESRRVTTNGKSRVRHVNVAYLGKFDNVYDAWMNADLKRRAKLAKYLKPEDVVGEAQARAEAEAEREYRRKLKQKLTREIVQQLLPRLPKQYLADLELGE
jgi:hypothetical protein